MSSTGSHYYSAPVAYTLGAIDVLCGEMTQTKYQIGSPGLRKDLFGIPLVFSPDVSSEFGSSPKTDPRCGSIQRVEIALPHPDGRHGPAHGISEIDYGCVARSQLTVVFNLEVKDR